MYRSALTENEESTSALKKKLKMQEKTFKEQEARKDAENKELLKIVRNLVWLDVTRECLLRYVEASSGQR